jgi:ribosome recycling factor
MTQENRLESVKKLNEKQEKAKISARQLRDDVKTAIEGAFAAKEFGEDDKFRFVKELDDEITKLNDEIKNIRDKKEKEIMEM